MGTQKQREDLGFTEEWLRDQYYNLGKGCGIIGKEIGRDAKTVYQWCKLYGFEMRKPGCKPSDPWAFKKGHKVCVGRVLSAETRKKMSESSFRIGRVPYLKDGIHYMKGKDYDKTKHNKWKGGISAERQAFYSTAEWVNCVKAVWKRDNAICQRCGKNHNTIESKGTFHIHHIVSFMVKEKRLDIDNLVLICKPCHLFVHSNKNTNGEFLK